MRTIKHSGRTWACRLSVTVALAVILPGFLTAQAGSRERTLYVSAVDKKGEPVQGLGPDDFVIHEDGVAREVLRVTHATGPIDIAMLVENGAGSQQTIPRVREGLTAFIDAMANGNQIAIIRLAPFTTVLVDYSSNPKRLRDAVGLLWPMSHAGSTFMDPLYDVARALVSRDAPRAVIVPIISGGGSGYRQYTQVMNEVKRAGAAIHAITIGYIGSSNSDDLRNRGRVLAEGTRMTGGQWVTLLTPIAMRQTLERLSRELSSQYMVVYGRPESLVAPERIEVSAQRPDLTMRGTPERRR